MTMLRSIRSKGIALIIVLSSLLSGCKMALLDPKGVIAASEKSLLIDSTLLMLLVVIPVIVMTFLFAWRYRAQNTTAKYSPDWSHSTLLEVTLWTIPCIIIVILAVMTWVSTHKLDPYRPLDVNEKPLIVEAIALDWKWLFIYPEQHIAAVNLLEIPVNKPIRLFITADAPMNSLEIPQLAGQIYAMTGMRTKLNLMASEVGDYRGLSTNFSGDGFSDMFFSVHVTSEAEFDNWVLMAKQSSLHLTESAYAQLAKPSEKEPVKLYANASNQLFSQVVMKYMGPDMSKMADENGEHTRSAMMNMDSHEMKNMGSHQTMNMNSHEMKNMSSHKTMNMNSHEMKNMDSHN